MKQFVLAIGLTLFGCSDVGDRKTNMSDTPTSGSIRIAVDESLKPLIDAEIKAFEGIYRHATINAIYVSETEAVRLLVADSVRLAIITRELTSGEKADIRNQHITPHRAKVAREGVALIVNKSNPDTLWDMRKLRDVLGGKVPDAKVVFDNRSSGIVRLVLDSIVHSSKMPANSYAVESNEGVIDYITKDHGSVGLIGASWISDRDDSLASNFMKSINVVALKNNNGFYQPHQAYIAQRLYPLTRDVIINSREARSGLGSGFMSFVAGEKGQRVVLKAGLVPVTMPIRLVEISSEDLSTY